MKPISGYWYAPPGCSEVVMLQPGETVDGVHKKLKRLAKSYNAQGHKHFRVRRVDDQVIWERVSEGQHKRLSEWHALGVGECVKRRMVAPAVELERAKATARYLRRAGRGTFEVDADGDLLLIRRLGPPRI